MESEEIVAKEIDWQAELKDLGLKEITDEPSKD